MHFGCCALNAVNQVAAGVCANVHFGARISMVALFVLVHFWISAFVFVLGRFGRVTGCCVYNGSAVHNTLMLFHKALYGFKVALGKAVLNDDHLKGCTKSAADTSETWFRFLALCSRIDCDSSTAVLLSYRPFACILLCPEGVVII